MGLLRLLGGVGQGEVCGPGNTDGGDKGLEQLLVEFLVRAWSLTYNLELDGHDPEVDDLHSRPDQEVGLQRRDIDVLEFALHSALSTTLCNCHVCEERSKPSWREQELIESHTLERGDPCAADLCDGECLGQETEPAVLNGRHEETVGHEADRALEVKGRRELLRVRDDIVFGPWVAAVEVVDFDRKEVVFAGAAFAVGALADCCQGLGYCVCDATKNL